MEIIHNHLSANKYNSDEQMARFWVTHANQIEIIMPGKGSTHYEKNKLIFESLSEKADQIHNHPIPWWEPLMRISPN